MGIKQIAILGIDALEYNLVEEWNLKNLKQEEHGKTILPISKEDGYFYSEPSTLIIWPSFITGFPPKKHGVDTIKKYPLNSLYKVYLKFFSSSGEDHLTPIASQKTLKRKIMDRASHIISQMNFSRNPSKEDIKSTTIFDLPNSIHLHIPVYDEDAFPPYKKKLVEAIENKTYRPILEMQCIEEFKQRSKEVFEWLERKNEWDLFMQYFFVLDAIQHVFYNNPKKIAKYYIMFDEFVGKVREKIDDDTLLLIVSDHGQHKGIHTPYGFYSVNKPLGLKNPKLIDFRWIIEGMIKNES